MNTSPASRPLHGTLRWTLSVIKQRRSSAELSWQHFWHLTRYGKVFQVHNLRKKSSRKVLVFLKIPKFLYSKVSREASTVCQRRNTGMWEIGDRCFVSAGPRLRNTLPAHLRQCDSLRQFKRLLKNSSVWFLRLRCSVTFLLGVPCINFLTYLLTQTNAVA